MKIFSMKVIQISFVDKLDKNVLIGQKIRD